jgi:predicted ArsR family transcriptional regulator
MLLPVFRDLIKPQWLAVLLELKRSGGMSASELARATGSGYMTAKTHCEDLMKAGYVIRTRLPRTAVGRPEILYSLGPKTDALFPQAGLDFTLELLDEVRQMFGESGPEKLLFQYFQKRGDAWAKALEKAGDLPDKAAKLAKLRQKEGYACECVRENDGPLCLVELHNPLQRVLEQYPRAITMEVRMLEGLLGRRVNRRELPGGRDVSPRVVFEIS